MDISIQIRLKIKKYIFWTYACSCCNWKTVYHRLKYPHPFKNNRPSIKVPLIFWFLITTFNKCFYTQRWLNEYVYILEIVMGILDNLTADYWNVCGCLTLNKIQIELSSLIVFSINNNLTNTSSIAPNEVKKQYYI